MGDRLILYTDGITESMDSDNQMYGEDTFMAFIKNHKGHIFVDLK